MLNLISEMNIDKDSKIVIQGHNNPDADALACSYTVKRLLNYLGYNNVRLAWFGDEIKKPNLVLFSKYLDLINGDNDLEDTDLLINVDCQYGKTNVRKIDSNLVFCIDHHQQEKCEIPLSWVKKDVRSNYASCSSIIFEYFLELKVPIDDKIGTALYYGLCTDSLSFTERLTEHDIRVREYLEEEQLVDLKFIERLKKENLSRDDVAIIQNALAKVGEDDDLKGVLILRVNRCDQNVLGCAADFLIEIAGIDIVIVFFETEDMYKISSRSINEQLSAYEIIQEVTKDIGQGGGHLKKAGGSIDKEKFALSYRDDTIVSYINRVLVSCFEQMKHRELEVQ